MTSKKFIKALASLKLAVLVILSLAIACATATVLESLYDIPTARFWVYKAFWFRGILLALGINILFVMIDRWPWKKNHAPFLLAHIGILTLLAGSLLTEKIGLDGSLRVTEGDRSSAVELDEALLVVSELGASASQAHQIPIQWIPPELKFKPYSIRERGVPLDIQVTDYITHSEPVFEFLPKTAAMTASAGMPARPALHFKLTGGPMRITQDFWLWTGDPSTQGMQAGPAWLQIVDHLNDKAQATNPGYIPPRGPSMTFFIEKNGISYRSISSSKEITTGLVPLSEIPKDGKAEGRDIDPHWKAVKITLLEYIPDAWVSTTFRPSRVQHGEMAPPPAIRIVATSKDAADAKSTGIWLGMGSRAVLNSNGRDLEVGFFNRRVMLPFAVKLDRFTVDRYQGTNNPASYSSQVSVEGDKKFSQLISMNEPLDYKGITLYQASYEDAQPRPTTSILAVNRDPGRIYKYIGSLLIVFGSIWLFALKYKQKKTTPKKEAHA